MIDDDRRYPPLGLRAFAGVVDDEGIDRRQGAERRLGEARTRQRQPFARQPFEIAVLAHENRGMPAAQPRVKREIAVRRHEGGVVIARLRIDFVAARGLDRDGDMPEFVDRQHERAVGVTRVGFGRPPARIHRRAHARRQARQERGIRLERQHHPARRGFLEVGGPRHQPRHQRFGRCGRVRDAIARAGQRAQDRKRRCGRIEPHAVGQTSVLARVVGEHQGDLPRRGPRTAQTYPCGGEIRDERAAIAVGLEADEFGFGRFVAAQRSLEPDRAREDAAVELGQRHVHGDVARPQTARARRPSGARLGREHGLQHRRVQRGERIARADRKAGQVDRHVGRVRGELGRQERARSRILEARDVDRARVEPARGERFDQRVHRGEIPGLIMRAIKHHRGDRRARPRMRMRVKAGPRDSDGGGGLRRTRRKIGHEGERARVVRRAALREIRRQPREIRTRDGR